MAAAPLIIVADDDPQILTLMRHLLGDWGYRVAVADGEPALLRLVAAERPALVLLDLRFGDYDGVQVLENLLKQHPGVTVAMLTGHGSIDAAVQAIKNGAYEFLTKPPDQNRLQLVLKHAVEKHRLEQKIRQLEQMVNTPEISRPIWGNSMAMRRVRELIATVAPTDATVLILGESGTGKELVARAIHERSARHRGPFVPVNMAAMPRELMESTLFGHEKGAFTGADHAEKGCCEAADGGTLFLDEIAELDFGLQSKLLRFLQERTIQRVGSSKIQTVDVRIVSATNRDPEQEVRAGRLREDLYYRLHVIPIAVAPLRERPEDIPFLATMFLRRSAARNKREVTGFSDDALKALSSYDWPGNVRQLENLVERIVILARRKEIGIDSIPEEIQRSADLPAGEYRPVANGPVAHLEAAPPTEEGVVPLRAIDRIERQAIMDALERSQGNVVEAARILGLGQATVYRKIKRYRLRPHAQRS